MISTNSASKVQSILDLAYSLSFKDKLYLLAMVFRSFFGMSLKGDILSSSPETDRIDDIQQSNAKGWDKVDRAKADFWPEDESIDDFLDLIHEQRQASLVS